MKKSQKERRAALQAVIKEFSVGDQESLIELVKQHYGLEVSQAAISRDLRALGVTKKMQNGEVLYAMPERDASQEILALAVRSCTHNESLIIVTTVPGLAAFVADYIDMQTELEVLGTIAGENCIFVAPKNQKNMGQLFKKISRLLGIKNSVSP